MKHAWVIGILSCLLLTVMGGTATASSVLMTDVRYWLAPDHIQTDLAFNVPVTPSYHHRTNPTRFVLEIPNCEYLWGNQTITVNDALLQRIRVQRLNNNTVQVVFDLSKHVEAYVQTLPATNGQTDRVIVTLADIVQQIPVLEASTPTVPVQVAAASQAPLQGERQKLADPFQTISVPRQYTVVIDPGHGGQDSGAVGPNGTQEKHVVLEIAGMMKTLIEHNAPSIQVYLTRDDDFFLSLRKRTEIAEEYNADLFISLHVNANPSRKVNGFSVYTLSENASDAAARELAEKENAVDLLFGGIETPVPNKDALLTFVLADLSKTAWLQHSLEFSQLAVETTVAALGSYKIAREGIKRANFAVLRTAAMPAVLVEACYISNEKEEGLLARKDFQTKIAQALSKSTLEYFAHRQSAGKQQTAHAPKKADGTVLLASAASQPASQPKMHVVKSGESLSVIAGKYRVALTQLCQVNNLTSTDMIYVGQRLWIP